MTGSHTAITRRAQQASHSIRRFFDAGNLFRFLVSILLALGLWVLVTYQNDPETTRVMGGMTVTIANLDSEFELVGDPPTVDITIQGPQSIVSPLERDSVNVVADMDGTDSAGSHDVEIDVDAPSDVRVRDVVPASVTLEVDSISERSDVPVVVSDPADPPANVEVSAIDIQPETLSISGPGRTVDEVQEAQINLRIDGQSGRFTESLLPIPVDVHGDPVEGLTVEPDQISVTVTVDVVGESVPVIDPTAF